MAHDFFSNLTGMADVHKELAKMALKVEQMPAIKCGVPNTGSYPDGTSLETVGLSMEFGTDNIPERSFLRSTLIENETKYNELLEKGLTAVTQGKEPDQILMGIALTLEHDVKEQITNITSPALAPSTIAARKGNSQNPLVDTGLLRSSIMSELE